MPDRRQFLRGATVCAAALSFQKRSLGQNMPHAPTVSAAATADFKPDIEIALTARVASVNLRAGSATTLWRYDGSVLAGDTAAFSYLDNNSHIPIIRASRGQKIRVHFTNALPESTTVHWHGLHMVQKMDGHPMYAIAPGATFVYEFVVDNRAGTYWFHPHPHERTGYQVYHGLSGLFLVNDPEEALAQLPQGDKDVALIIQDRTFDSGNQLVYLGARRQERMQGFSGQQVLINGQLSYTRDTQPTAYRLRIFNASNSSSYLLKWAHGQTFRVIATDGGLLEEALERQTLSIAPAERLEVWVDFSGFTAGQELQLLAETYTPALDNITSSQSGASLVQGARPIARFRLGGSTTSISTPPTRLSAYPPLLLSEAINQQSPRRVQLSMMQGNAMLNGRIFGAMDEVADDEKVRAQTVEVWEFANDSPVGMLMAHPMHIHNVQFRVLSRSVSSVQSAQLQTLRSGIIDEGLKDVVQVLPGERVQVLMRFEPHTGIYLTHCHILEHEDLGMMRNLLVQVALQRLHTVKSGGAATTAVIAGGISADGGLTLTTEVATPARVDIHASISPEAGHLGRTAGVVVVLQLLHSNSWLTLAANGELRPFNNSAIEFYKEITALQNYNEISLYSGSLATTEKGVFHLYIGYAVDGSRNASALIYSAEPLILTVR
ncbi:MAG: multicopper oxidase domain-containing protein [Gammaproteobacteria bacterium]|nr:multicopper oxidase domain-containing protein [Gammaproteobacteria bacterium]